MTTLTSKHSPTPWIATTEKDKDGFVQVLTNEKSPFGDIWAVAYEVTPENAAFIVQAVNSFDAREAEIAKLRDAHEALVKAVLVARGYAMNSCTCPSDVCTKDCPAIQIEDLCETALKLAKRRNK